MTKDKTINIRVESDWLEAVDNAAARYSEAAGTTISRNAFIERAVEQAVRAVDQADDDLGIINAMR